MPKLLYQGHASFRLTANDGRVMYVDYPLFCGDGFYNMDIAEAAECARLVAARHNILIHMVPNAVALFDKAKAEAWTSPNKLIIEPGQEIKLC